MVIPDNFLQLVEALCFLVFLPTLLPVVGALRPPVWAWQGVPVEDKPGDSRLHPQGLFLLPVLKAAAWGESTFRLSLAWAQALAAQPPAELCGLGLPHQV